jgi:17beta-estradiol 17-dehydrogenase / very-long-chain 3-oxoacyl-CoA reductase
LQTLNIDAYLVTTKLAKIRKPSLLVATENAFVRSALHNIGRDGATYWSHAYVNISKEANQRLYEWFLAYVTPLVGGLQGAVVIRINKAMHEGIRRRALKKAAKSK